MTRYLARSAEVLSKADSFEDRLNWQLFCAEQEAMLWGGEPGWRPGEPIHQRPVIVGFEYDGSMVFQGNCPRPMISELPIEKEPGYFKPRCVDCEVSWRGEPVCWSCGQTIDEPDFYMQYKALLSRYTAEDEVYWRRANPAIGRIVAPQLHIDTSGFREAGRAASEALRGFAERASLELSEWQERWVQAYSAMDARLTSAMVMPRSITPVPYYPPPTTRTIFEEPDIRGPLWGVAALYDPITDRDESLSPGYVHMEFYRIREMDLSWPQIQPPVIDIRMRPTAEELVQQSNQRYEARRDPNHYRRNT